MPTSLGSAGSPWAEVDALLTMTFWGKPTSLEAVPAEMAEQASSAGCPHKADGLLEGLTRRYQGPNSASVTTDRNPQPALFPSTCLCVASGCSSVHQCAERDAKCDALTLLARQFEMGE